MQLPDLNEYRTLQGKKTDAYPLPVTTHKRCSDLGSLPAPPTGKSGWPWTEDTDPNIYNRSLSWPKITIVTPSYNQGAFIEETIRSILLQNYPNLEYIVIDGGSSDETVEILNKYSPWISYWQSEKDRGQAHAINIGFSMASGDYYGWLNSDDYYVEAAFKHVVSAFRESSAEFVYGYGYNITEETGGLSLVKVLPFFDYFIRIPSLIQPSCFWKAGIHKPVWEAMNCSLDYELWQRLIKNKGRKLIKAPLSVTRIHEDAKSHDPKMRAAWETDHQLICSIDAYGPVNDWNWRVFLYKVYRKLYYIPDSKK